VGGWARWGRGRLKTHVTRTTARRTHQQLKGFHLYEFCFCPSTFPHIFLPLIKKSKSAAVTTRPLRQTWQPYSASSRLAHAHTYTYVHVFPFFLPLTLHTSAQEGHAMLIETTKKEITQRRSRPPPPTHSQGRWWWCEEPQKASHLVSHQTRRRVLATKRVRE
jgi:hypothetical protein